MITIMVKLQVEGVICEDWCPNGEMMFRIGIAEDIITTTKLATWRKNDHENMIDDDNSVYVYNYI